MEKIIPLNEQLPSVKYLTMFGAPVSLSIHENFANLLPNGTTYTPYGATESLPVSNANGINILKQKENMESGKGTFLGLPLKSVDIKIIKQNSDGEIRECSQDEIGEIVVSGDVVTKKYYQLQDETDKAKFNYQNQFWHKIGDVGYLDKNNHLWFCGRKTHVIETKNTIFYPIPCEAVFNKHINVKKSALVKIKNNPAICVIPNKTRPSVKELKEIALSYTHTKEIDQFYFVKKFPVDVRHNIKIDRLLLSKMISRNIK